MTPDITDTSLRSQILAAAAATHEEIAKQRENAGKYKTGPRQAQAMPYVKPMPYVAIDLETTGLDPDCAQIIEFGAVIDDWVTPVESLPSFHAYIIHDHFVSDDPYALWLNSEIFKRIANRNKPENKEFAFLEPKELAPLFQDWLIKQAVIDSPREAFTPAGKNFGGFDRGFLKKLPGFDKIKIRHRAIDPAVLFWNPLTDKTLPDTKTCMERSGQNGEVKHTAIEDSIAVINMIRFAINNKFNFQISIPSAHGTRTLMQGVLAEIRKQSQEIK